MSDHLNLAGVNGRCEHGFHPAQRELHDCAHSDDWHVFLSALRSVARDDGTVHQADMRPRIRGRIEPKVIGTLYRRARAEHIIRDTGQREPSNDAAGRNTDKLDRIYALGRAA